MDEIRKIAEIASKAICILAKNGIVSADYISQNLHTRQELLDYLNNILNESR